MAISLITSVKATPGANGGATGSIDTTGATLLVVLIADYRGGTGFSLSDSKGNSWTALTQQTTSGGLVGRCQIHYCVPTSVGSGHTFTYSGSGGYPIIMAMAFSGTHATTPFDAENGAVTTTGTTIQPGSLTPSENNEVVVTVVSENNGTAPTIDSGYTVAQSGAASGGNNVAGGAAYIIQTTASATNPTWTIGASADAAAASACFKSDGAGGGGSTNSRLLDGLVSCGLLGGRLVR